MAGPGRGRPGWIARDETRQQLRLRGLLDRTQAINGRQDTASVQLAFRGVPPGSYTVEAIVAGTAMRRTVEVAVGPAVVRDVDFP